MDQWPAIINGSLDSLMCCEGTSSSAPLSIGSLFAVLAEYHQGVQAGRLVFGRDQRAGPDRILRGVRFGDRENGGEGAHPAGVL